MTPATRPSPHAAPRGRASADPSAGDAGGWSAARPVRQAWFVSDLHLRRGDPDGVARARAFVAHAREQGTDALFFVGDVFQAWIGPRSLHDPGLRPFLEDLGAAVDAGLRVVALEGNHDFLMEQNLAGALGVESPGDVLDVALGGQRVRLLHGDAFCTLDAGYHRLHAVLRSTGFRWVARHLPVKVIEAVAVTLMRVAARFSAGKRPEVMDIVDDEVRRTLRSGVDVVLCGHVHKARDERVEGAGRLIVMADFETTGSHAVFRDGRLELVAEDERFAPAAGPVVTLDGPAGSGKSSVAARLAARLGWVKLDSGALYRAVTAAALERGVDLADGPGLGALARVLRLSSDAAGRVRGPHGPIPDGVLRSPQVSAAVSGVSAHPEVRRALMEVQRRASRGVAGIVAEGRDMGTVVFPDALLKVYLDASPEVRARRRLAQNAGEGGSLDQVLAAQAERDARDAGRSVAPLRPAPGAWVLDTSGLDLDAVVERLAERVEAEQVRGA